MTDKKNNVIHLERQRPPPADRNPFLKLASQLIEEHSTCDSQAAEQRIEGDNNFQYASQAVARQVICGNGNIQIFTMDPCIESRLTSLETLLKKCSGVRDIASAATKKKAGYIRNYRNNLGD